MSAASVAAVIGDCVDCFVDCSARVAFVARPGFVVRHARVGGFGVWFSGWSGVVFGVCDTPVEFSVSNGLLGVRWGRVCVFVGCGVSFSLAAAQRVVPAGPVPRGG